MTEICRVPSGPHRRKYEERLSERMCLITTYGEPSYSVPWSMMGTMPGWNTRRATSISRRTRLIRSGFPEWVGRSILTTTRSSVAKRSAS